MTETEGQLPPTPPPGQGWWLASDGNWYPPETVPAPPVPPAPGRQNAWQRFRANPLWLQAVAWATVAFIALGVIGAAVGTGKNKTQKTAAATTSSSLPSTTASSSSKATTTSSSTTTTTAPTTTTTTAPPTTTTPPTTAPPTTASPFADETVSQRNARNKAQDYLDYTSFSRTGLIKQLEFEGFSHDDSTYAVDALNVDWNDQAAKKAADYLNYTSFSHQSLVDQLEFDGFTPDQAEYGVSTTGL